MLRSVAIGLALSALVAACAVFIEPIPAGTSVWAISIPGWGTIPITEVTSIRGCRTLVIDIEADAGYGGIGCATP